MGATKALRLAGAGPALTLGKIEGGRRGQQRMRWLDGITASMDMSLPLRQTQRSPEGPRHLHRIPRLSEAPREVP